MEENREQPCCAVCAQPLSEEEIEICAKQAGRFDNKLLCFAHQRLFCGCPGVRGQKLP